MVNDGSTDHSDEIGKEYCEKDKRFRIYEQSNILMDELLIKRIYNSMIGKKLISDSEMLQLKSAIDEFVSNRDGNHYLVLDDGSLERQGLLRLLPEADEISCSQETWPLF